MFFLKVLNLSVAKISPQIKVLPYIEFGTNMVWILFYFIAANIIIKYVRWSGIIGASVFFGYLAILTYVIDAALLFMKFKSQGTVPDGGEQAWTTHEPPPKY